jgi:hypothetical protein
VNIILVKLLHDFRFGGQVIGQLCVCNLFLNKNAVFKLEIKMGLVISLSYPVKVFDVDIPDTNDSIFAVIGDFCGYLFHILSFLVDRSP